MPFDIYYNNSKGQPRQADLLSYIYLNIRYITTLTTVAVRPTQAS